MTTPVEILDNLRRQIDYFRQRLHELSARLLRADRQLSTLRHELERKRRGFRLLAELSAALHSDDADQAFRLVARRLSAVLAMQRTVLLQAAEDGAYRPTLLDGYADEEAAALSALTLPLAPAMLHPGQPALQRELPGEPALAAIGEALRLPYFVSAAIHAEGGHAAILVTGRTRILPPFLPPLEDNDAETVQAIAGLLGALHIRQRLQETSHQANHDPLTGLPNLRLAKDRLRQVLLQAQRSGSLTALLFIDLDGFKQVNDTLGHDAGDALLCILADRLNNTVRMGDTVARLGGDEFIALLPAIQDCGQAEQIAERMLRSVSEPVQLWGRTISLGASIGIAFNPGQGDSAETLIAAADAAMYQVKRQRKRGYRLAGAGSNHALLCKEHHLS
ncbi:GGDEF domain-containing protein [Chromobacterium sp. IIBBL 290-4]|uniref:GGDEF domain-containing protein n=1 Tax=Chromobacterium sp. IIBBL 290-4 TaxID=2953890 RepID=UPI0020B75004|nr:GGDEF domain-containing protein [Chromobacterium sp. IIBBL 290-4]UTH74614.1 GGDEF domain-containing protein [Chromobacterium sp. IIBBL 290-4]